MYTADTRILKKSQDFDRVERGIKTPISGHLHQSINWRAV